MREMFVTSKIRPQDLSENQGSCCFKVMTHLMRFLPIWILWRREKLISFFCLNFESSVISFGTISAQKLHVHTANKNLLHHFHLQLQTSCTIYEPLRPFNHLCSWHNFITDEHFQQAVIFFMRFSKSDTPVKIVLKTSFTLW